MSRAERWMRLNAYGMCSIAACRFLTLGMPKWVVIVSAIPTFALWVHGYLAIKREVLR